ncbi:MAG: hypothetical protein QM564_12380 [Bergeyella sp.]
MRKLTIVLGVFFITGAVCGQVGINTTDPKAVLDINGNLKIRTVNTVTSVTNDHYILLRDHSTAGDFEVKEISAANLLGENADSGTAYSAAKSGSWSLLDLGIGGGWYRTNLTGSTDTRVGDSSLFTNGVYTAPSAGIYKVTYELQLASGVNLGLLTGMKLGLLKNNTLWEEKRLDGVRVELNLPLGIGLQVADVPVTSTTMDTLVQLSSGDTLTFAFNTNGLLPVNLGLLTGGRVSLHIYKVSD